MMKKLLTVIFFISFTAISFSQAVIEKPKYGFSSSKNVKIVRIELKDSSTVIWFHTTSIPGSTISIPENTYIAPQGSSEKLFVTSTDGIPLGKSVTLPSSGSINYKLIFPEIKTGVTLIDYGEEEGNWHIYDIILKNIPSKSVIPVIPEEIRGHWFNTENGQWAISFLDTVVVYEKKLWSYAGVKYKNHEGSFSIKNKNSITELPVKLDKNGHLILRKSTKSLILGKDALTIRKALKENENLFAPPVFIYDSVVFSGYLKGYTPRIGVRTGTMYVNNLLTGNQDNYLINVSGNGYFSVKIPVYYPHDVFINSDLFSESVFLEPGKDLFMMIDPDQEVPMFMGENALLNTDMQALRKINAIDNYDIMQQRILNMSPDMYKKYFLELKSRELRTLDSMMKLSPLSSRAIQLKKLSIDYLYAYRLMEYNMAFEGAYRRINKIPSSQRTLPVMIEKPVAEYYDFVTNEQANNSLAVLANEYYYYINRLKYNELIRIQPGGYSTVELMRAIANAGYRLTEEEKAMLSDIEANLDQEANNEINAFIKKYSARYGDFSRKYSAHLSEMTKINKDQPLTASIIEKYLADQGVELTEEEKEMLAQKSSIDNSEGVRKNSDLMSKYNLQINNFNSDHSNEISVVLNRRSKMLRNENIEKAFGVHKGLATDIMEAQDECRYIVGEVTPIPVENLQSVLEQITTPFISWYIEKCNNETISKIAENKKQPLPAEKKTTAQKLKSAFVETPAVKSDVLFETILSKYKGKVVYVDFWATWCSPCRSENERIKPLKEALAGKDIVFVYITNQTSPLKTYNNMIPDIPGEHYRLTSDERNYLSNKFNISGIPHKVLVDKNGVVVDPALLFVQNNALLNKLEKLLNQ